MKTRMTLTTALIVTLVSSAFVGIVLACHRPPVDEEIVFTQEFDWNNPRSRVQVDTRVCELKQDIEIRLNSAGKITHVKLDGFKVTGSKTVRGFEVEFLANRAVVRITQTGYKPFHTLLRRISLLVGFRSKTNKTATMKSAILVKSSGGDPVKLTATATAGVPKR
jgi:hypothetical protein